MTTTTEQQLRSDLAAAHRMSVMDGFSEGTWNHLSAKLPDDPEQILITPGDLHWSQVKASNLAIMGPDPKAFTGPVSPNSAAWIIHYPIHRARPDCGCLMHVHPPHATALGMRKDCVLDTCLSQNAAILHDDVSYLNAFDGVLRKEEEGERMATALGEKRVLMMRNHGVLVAAEDIPEAYYALYCVERASMYQLLAVTDSNMEMNRIPLEVVTKMSDPVNRGPSGAEGNFRGMKKVIEQREPDYCN